jgi:hypothetical protein
MVWDVVDGATAGLEDLLDMDGDIVFVCQMAPRCAGNLIVSEWCLDVLAMRLPG